MQLSDLEDWIEKARKLKVELENEPSVVFRNESKDTDGNTLETAYHVVDVIYSYRGNTITFVIE